MLNKKALTLIELIIACILMGTVILGITGLALFFVEQVTANMERQRLQSQIDYAFEDMQLRCLSASKSTTSPVISPGGTSTHLEFIGEQDIYAINPSGVLATTKRLYRYDVSVASDIVLRTCPGTTTPPCEGIKVTTEEILVDHRFAPPTGTNFLQFNHTTGTEPNFLTVTIRARTERAPIGADRDIAKSDGLRFWFVDVVE